MFSKTFFATAILLVCVGSVAMQTAPASPEPHKVAVGSYKFRLEERDGKCQVFYEGRQKGELALEIPPPCEFVRDHAGKGMHYQYKRRRNAGVYDVILIVGGPVNRDRSDKLMQDGCATKMQAVSFSSRGVTAGPTGSVRLVCPTEGLDEKFFATLGKPI